MQTSAYLTPKEAAEYLHLSRRTIYEWVRTGRLMSYKTGPHRSGKVLIKQIDLDRCLTRND
jgi:excisionase family DNA binding protein